MEIAGTVFGGPASCLDCGRQTSEPQSITFVGVTLCRGCLDMIAEEQYNAEHRDELQWEAAQAADDDWGDCDDF